MRILYLLHRFVPMSLGGTEVTVHRVGRLLSRRHAVAVSFPYRGRPRPNESFPWEGLDVRPFPEAPSGMLSRILRPVPADPIWERAALSVLDEFRPDLLHIYHLQGVPLRMVEAARERGIRIVFTLQDFWYYCFRSHLTRANFYACAGPRRDYRNCERCRQETAMEKLRLPPVALLPFSSPSPVRSVLRHRSVEFLDLLNRADLLLAPSRFLRENYIAQGVRPDHFHHLRDGVDLSALKDFRRTSTDLARFGYVGSLLPHKGIVTLIEAANAGKFDLTLHGPFEPDRIPFHAELRRRAGPTIRFAGRFNDLRVPFSQMDCLVLPSECYENCPAAILQAFATSTPVIASRIGGIPELVEEGVNALLFRAGDRNELQGCLERASNRGLLSTLTTRIHAPADLEDHAARLVEFYETVCRR